jgi:hypothetical protein
LGEGENDRLDAKMLASAALYVQFGSAFRNCHPHPPSPMRPHYASPLLLSALLAAPAAAQSLTSVQPTSVVQVDPSATGSTRTITVRGTGITPGANVGEDIARTAMQLRRAGGAWVTLSRSGGGITTNQQSVSVWSRDWFAVPGTLEVRMVVDGRPTNALPIQVTFAPTTPAEITQLSPAHLRPGQTSAAAYQFYVRGTRYSDPATVTVAGIPAPIARISVDEGYALVYLPAELRSRPGRYPVMVTTRAGSSYARYVEVDGPPNVVAVEPGEVVKERAGDAASVRVRVRFDGAAPTAARVGNDAVGWVAVSELPFADDPMAVWVDVPMAQVQAASAAQPQAIQIVLSNASGSGTGTLTARSDGSITRVQQIGPGVVRPRVNVPTTPVARPPAPPRPGRP